MGLKSKVCIATLVAGAACLVSGLTTGFIGLECEDNAREMLKSDHLYRLTTELNEAESNYNMAIEQYVSGEVDETEYQISKLEYEYAKEEYAEESAKLESESYVTTLMNTDSVLKSEECINEYEQGKNLLVAARSCLAATIPFGATGIILGKLLLEKDNLNWN